LGFVTLGNDLAVLEFGEDLVSTAGVFVDEVNEALDGLPDAFVDACVLAIVGEVENLPLGWG